MRLAFGWLAPRLRTWDVISANRVDHFVANSSFVARRIRRCWRREAEVVHPPVDLEAFTLGPAPGPDAPYLFLSELAPYKRADLAVLACKALDRPLKVVGQGSEMERLKRLAGPRTEFAGRAPDRAMRGLYQECRALLFPGVEDFGIVPLEAMACGRPVIALGRGGALDTVRDRKTGLLFQEQTVEGLSEAIRHFEAEVEPALDRAAVAAHAGRFSAGAFRAGMWDAIRRAAPQLGLAEAPPATDPSGEDRGCAALTA